MKLNRFEVEAQYTEQNGKGQQFILGITMGLDGSINIRPSNTVSNGGITLSPEDWSKFSSFVDEGVEDFTERAKGLSF